MEERREIAAEQTTDVGEQKRQPGEQRELLEVHAAHADHVERYPEGESLPCRLGQETRDDDAEELLLRQDRRDRWLRPQRRLPAGIDVFGHIFRQAPLNVGVPINLEHDDTTT